MKLNELGGDRHLDELLPAVGAALGGAAKAVGGALATGTRVAGQAMAGTSSGLAGGQMNPAQAAAAAKERADQKKAIQDQIKATEQQLTDLRKRLAELG